MIEKFDQSSGATGGQYKPVVGHESMYKGRD
jgi:hypothetical protein